MHAYSETYLSGAQRRMGAMLDFAVNGCSLELPVFYAMFLASSIAVRMGAGDPALIAGRSGEELTCDIVGPSALDVITSDAWKPDARASAEYWTGWALACFQWASGISYENIQRDVPIDAIHALYNPYHEMDIRQFCDRMTELIADARIRTNLQRIRRAAGFSQSQLARASGVPLRTLQQYEQRQKNINHARADYILAVARALSCAPADLLECEIESSFEYAVVTF
ncbi:MAG: helix-turn-helix transcriptional regulator [Atopobiaceae bacterium]|nr:helix-turn-helix transcriptional regulator [Atopobiaceae bacterium]